MPGFWHNIIKEKVFKSHSSLFTLGYLLCIHLKFSLEIGLFLLCIYHSPWKHTSLFICSSWQLSMEHFPLAILPFSDDIFENSNYSYGSVILATSAGRFKYWRYGKSREFRVKLNFAPKIPELFTRNSRVQAVRLWAYLMTVIPETRRAH